MPASPTLRSLLHLPTQPEPLSKSALILIDCQNTYREGVMQLEGVEPALKECASLLQRAATAVRRSSTSSTRLARARPTTRMRRSARSPMSWRRVPARRSSPRPIRVSFEKTDLDAELKRLGVTDLVIAGFMTHVCVNSTSRAAFNLRLPPDGRGQRNGDAVSAQPGRQRLAGPGGSRGRADGVGGYIRYRGSRTAPRCRHERHHSPARHGHARGARNSSRSSSGCTDHCCSISRAAAATAPRRCAIRAASSRSARRTSISARSAASRSTWASLSSSTGSTPRSSSTWCPGAGSGFSVESPGGRALPHALARVYGCRVRGSGPHGPASDRRRTPCRLSVRFDLLRRGVSLVC